MARKKRLDPGVPFVKLAGNVPKVTGCYAGWLTVYSPGGAYGAQCAVFAPSVKQLRLFWKRMTKIPMQRRHCQRVAFFSERDMQQVGKTEVQNETMSRSKT